MHPLGSNVVEAVAAFARIEKSDGDARSERASTMLAECFRHRPVIVLSPHFDDACFSLGAFLHAAGHGRLINIFTRGGHVVDPRMVKAGLRENTITVIRDLEDQEFAKRCGFSRHNLECEEPSLRGRRPSEIAGLADDMQQAEKKLLPLLTQVLAEEKERPALFAPLGIGRHVNHRAVAEVVFRHLARLETCFDLHFYEDLPYASNLIHRGLALKRLKWHVGPTRRHVFVTPWREKRALICIYQSQFRRAPSWPLFRPASLLPPAVHEAFWSLAGKRIKGDSPCSGVGPVSS